MIAVTERCPKCRAPLREIRRSSASAKAECTRSGCDYTETSTIYRPFARRSQQQAQAAFAQTDGGDDGTQAG